MPVLITKLHEIDSLEDSYLYVAQQYNFKKHPYFLWMHEESACESFLQSQLSFRYAVESFSCALAACLSKISHLERRIHLAENVQEEHGGGDLRKAHKHTFLEFLRALGAREEQLLLPCNLGVQAFNESIRNFCLANSGACGAALLGMIEYLYIDISAQIAQKISTSKWVLPNSQSHYAAHEVIDVEHARELFEICVDDWDKSSKDIASAMALGGYYFWNLYLSMLEEVKSEMARK
ncbi:iron-containing redox enzyme family protein [Candidatus Uabimicrobium sp. HlEnr_7]|uniref:iron-containing redox enzyme family protein n=1 Tax=Candidatus Uabimicrobium helgolandensis TaxID=3095367 RepID=UPI0035562C7C